MEETGIGAKVLDAAGVRLSRPIIVQGMNTYNISSDFISWNDVHHHTLSGIAHDFGLRTSGVGDKVFTCGDDKITVYDFGLLFTVFTAMVAAQAELGDDFTVEEVATSNSTVRALWVGNDLIIYSVVNNIILPVDNSMIKSACEGERLECENFCTQDKFIVDRERVELFILDAAKRELFCRLRIGTGVQKSYSKCFESEDDKEGNKVTWDSSTKLGRLIAASGKGKRTKEVLGEYKKAGLRDSVSRRTDLFLTPDIPLNATTHEEVLPLLGRMCYTDKDEAVIAVNYRAGMLIYSPCFPGDGLQAMCTYDKPDMTKFFDINSGCEKIMRFAATVINRPLTPAQLDVRVFNHIVNSFLEKKLPRVSFHDALGKVVIPESVLEETFNDGFGADLFCMVPVGIVGNVVVCKTSEGNLEAVYPVGWTTTEAFYDITEVISRVER